MRQSLVRLEVCAWCAGLLALGALATFRWESHRTQLAAAQIRPVLAATRPQTASPAGGPAAGAPSANAIIGRLEIPELALTVPILNDYDPDSLRRGVGHIQGTAVPGGLGNFVIAGHRDTYFRPLRRIHTGMAMHIVTPAGNFDYVVDSTSIVLPSNLDVLDIGDRPEMTLITCYPFDYIGAAPKRFIVRGHLLSVAGEAS